MPAGANAEQLPARELLAQLGLVLDPELLERTLTHRSYAYEQGGLPTNERLEFLGDSVLGLVVTDTLYRIHPDLPGTAYFDLAREVKKRQPDIHLHAFSPMEIVNGSARTGLSFEEFLTAAREAGLDSVPGTAAEILDDDVRWVLTKGKLPAATWIEIISTAHRVGIPTTSTMMYGHVDTPAHWVAHLRTLAAIQDDTGGFTEFVLLPFVHHNAPIYLAGVARPGPTVRENRAVHAVARLLLHGRIPNIQTSWVKLAEAGTKAVLQGGVNDLGGTLMEETISRMAGSRHGSAKTVAQLHEIVDGLPGRRARQRTTGYGEVPAERLAAAGKFTGLLPSLAG